MSTLRTKDGRRIPGMRLMGPMKESVNALTRKRGRCAGLKTALPDALRKAPMQGGDGIAHKPAASSAT